jgi:hypothetical protein
MSCVNCYTVHGRCYRGRYIYSLDWFVGAIPVLVFPLCVKETLTKIFFSVKFRANTLNGPRDILSVRTDERTIDFVRQSAGMPKPLKVNLCFIWLPE